VEEPYRLTPQLALRIAILGTLALAAFAVLFLRLWSLEILSEAQYVRAAQNNQLRTLRIEAPRGAILDRNGKVLVRNVAGNAVQLWPAQLPKKRYRELRRLARILDVPLAQIVRGIERRKHDPLTPVTVKVAVHPDQVAFLSEHQTEFPAVDIVQTYLRDYPYGARAAHVLGYVGEASPTQLREYRKDGLRLGDQIGQGGVEATYDQYLRGRNGLAYLRVDSLGRQRGALSPRENPQAGHAIRLTLDAGLQGAAEQAIRYGIIVAHSHPDGLAADGGAIVAMDPRDGAILALASNPTYKPSVFVGRADPKKLAPLLNPRVAAEDNHPGLDRAIAGVYPAGSTFKPVTALAAMQEHLIAPYSTLPCTGAYTVYRSDGTVAQVFKNWDPNVNEQMTLPEALARSCDTYFYQLGHDFYRLRPQRGHPLQAWASRFGIGVPTGIDLGPENAGLLPTPEWRKVTFTKKSDPNNWQLDRLWKPGDSIQLAIGQKDLLVTPLQMARLYALIANGGRLVTPHLVRDVEQPGNNAARAVVLRRFTPPAPQPSGVDPAALHVVQEGLVEATHGALGTSSGVFGNFPITIAGKTGTAEKVIPSPGWPYGRTLSQSWWCGYGPAESPTLVVCALIENGGHGGEAAAPAALKVFEHYFGKQPSQIGSVKSD
jgi:penicillin-binding protein 2